MPISEGFCRAYYTALYFRRTPQPVSVTITENEDYVIVLSYSYSIPLLQGGGSSYAILYCTRVLRAFSIIAAVTFAALSPKMHGLGFRGFLALLLHRKSPGPTCTWSAWPS